MEVVELNILNVARASDFVIQHVIGSGQNGIVVAAKCTRKGLTDPNKLYAVKLLFNFTHEYSSVIRNTYENEWLILSRLLPHDNMVRFWSQFICVIPPAFSKILPEHVRKFTTHTSKSGVVVPSKGQFLVLDFHPEDFKSWSSRLSSPLSFETVLRFTEQLLEAVLYLEKNLIRHLDLKTSNLLVAAEDEKIVLCDFGCAVQFEDESFVLPYARGSHAGGNRAHLAPEVLSSHHRSMKAPNRANTIDYYTQASFAVGVLVCEMATGSHPLPDYPLGYTNNGAVSFSSEDVAPLPAAFPKSFCSIVMDLLSPTQRKRLPISEALNQLRVCCMRRSSSSSASASASLSSSSQLTDYRRLERERDLAKARLSVVATERDFAVREMKEMAEQCKSVAAEFQTMADHCDHIHSQLERVKGERDTALKACESAFEANELLRDQVKLVTRERELAVLQVEELRELTARCRLEETINECSCCHRFYLESDNTPTSCHWHSGVRLYTYSLRQTLCLYKSAEYDCTYA